MFPSEESGFDGTGVGSEDVGTGVGSTLDDAGAGVGSFEESEGSELEGAGVGSFESAGCELDGAGVGSFEPSDGTELEGTGVGALVGVGVGASVGASVGFDVGVTVGATLDGAGVVEFVGGGAGADVGVGAVVGALVFLVRIMRQASFNAKISSLITVPSPTEHSQSLKLELPIIVPTTLTQASEAQIFSISLGVAPRFTLAKSTFPDKAASKLFFDIHSTSSLFTFSPLNARMSTSFAQGFTASALGNAKRTNATAIEARSAVRAAMTSDLPGSFRNECCCHGKVQVHP